MPIIKSAKKAARQTVKRNRKNEQIKKSIKAAFKLFKASPSQENLAKAQSEYDKAAKKGLIKKNTASRRKANLAKIAKAAGVKLVAKKVAKPATKPTAKPVTKPTTKKPTAKTTKVPVKTPAKAITKKPTAKKPTTAKPATKKPSPKAKAEKK